VATIVVGGDMDGDATNAAVGVGTGEEGGDGTATAGGITVRVGNTKAGVLCDPDGGALPHPAIPPAKTKTQTVARKIRTPRGCAGCCEEIKTARRVRRRIGATGSIGILLSSLFHRGSTAPS